MAVNFPFRNSQFGFVFWLRSNVWPLDQFSSLPDSSLLAEWSKFTCSSHEMFVKKMLENEWGMESLLLCDDTSALFRSPMKTPIRRLFEPRVGKWQESSVKYPSLSTPLGPVLLSSSSSETSWIAVSIWARVQSHSCCCVLRKNSELCSRILELITF